jgi:hypothetical protein
MQALQGWLLESLFALALPGHEVECLCLSDFTDDVSYQAWLTVLQLADSGKTATALSHWPIGYTLSKQLTVDLPIH